MNRPEPSSDKPPARDTWYTRECLGLLRGMPDDAIDLVFASPPYENLRDYGIGFDLVGDKWVAWAWERYEQCLRVCKGLVAWVVEGRTTDYKWSGVPLKLMAKIAADDRYTLRKPPIFYRQGIPGSGGTDWLRNDYELIVCATKGKLPWVDQTAMGNEPKHRHPRYATNRNTDGTRKENLYIDPERSNPGNVLSLTVGGWGQMGWDGAHEGEAPFPEDLARFFVSTFCPPGGTVLDPFCGTGTTVAVAVALGRSGIGVDIRESQIELAKIRCKGLSLQDIRMNQMHLFSHGA